MNLDGTTTPDSPGTPHKCLVKDCQTPQITTTNGDGPPNWMKVYGNDGTANAWMCDQPHSGSTMSIAAINKPDSNDLDYYEITIV